MDHLELSKLDQIERAIGQLTSEERIELYARLDHAFPDEFEDRLILDVNAGRFDALIQGAIEDEKQGRTRPL